METKKEKRWNIPFEEVTVRHVDGLSVDFNTIRVLIKRCLNLQAVVVRIVRLLAGSGFFKAVQNMPIVGGDHVLTAASLPIRS